MSCVELVDSAKLLGVFVDRALSFHDHVEHIAKTCNQRFYLLQQMHKQGLNADCLKILFHSIVLSKILYALSAWGGYISGENESRLNKVLRKAKRYRYTDSVLTFSKLLEQSDEQLFSRVLCSNHCLFHLLEKDKSLFHMLLRARGHSFDLPRHQYNLTKLPGNLLSIETYIQISENRLPCVLCVHGCGVHDVYTTTLGGLLLLYIAYIHILSTCV